MNALSDKEVRQGLSKLEGWAVKEGVLLKEFTFKNFPVAFAFMTELAAVAERLNHHPNWRNVYNRVSISLTTHDTHGLTEMDFEFAEAADESARRLDA